MARRSFIKAYGDIVGGAGNDVSEVSRKPSALKVACKDVSHGKRKAVEIRPIEVNQFSNGVIEKGGGKTNFINIDGPSVSGIVKTKNPQHPTLPETAYKTRSFMSTVDLSAGSTHLLSKRMANPQTTTHAPPPTRIPYSSKTPEEVKMFLPKGIERTDQPYVVPKFMPSYREMMTPKRKPEPLVSILEPTPPSMQKWAVEWNAEPKHISIAELQEDIIRETSEKHRAPSDSIRKGTPKMATISDYNPHSKAEEPKPSEQGAQQPSLVSDTVEKEQSSAACTPQNLPWSHLSIPLTREPIGPTYNEKDTNQGKFMTPLVDWRPSRFSTVNDLKNPVYSFKEAIDQGVPDNASTSNLNGKHNRPLSRFTNPTEDSIYFDSEEQKFHQWFKERMSSAVQSAVVDQHKKSTAYVEADQPAAKSKIISSKPETENQNITIQGQLTNPNGKSEIPVAEDHSEGIMAIKTIHGETKAVDNSSTKRSGTLQKDQLQVSDEVDPNSSFCHWLKSRGHPLLTKVKNEPSTPPLNKTSSNTITKPLDCYKFPWSVSYKLRKNTSLQSIGKKLTAPKDIPTSRKLIFRVEDDSVKSRSLNYSQKSKKSFQRPLSKRSIRKAGKKSVKSAINVSKNQSTTDKSLSVNGYSETKGLRQATSVEHLYPHTIRNGPNTDRAKAAKRFLKPSSKRSVRDSGKKSIKGPIGQSIKEVSKSDSLRKTRSVENMFPRLFGDEGNTDSEKPLKTFQKQTSKRSVREAGKKLIKSESKESFDQSINGISQTDSPRQATSVENMYPRLFGNGGKIGSEIDHVNNMREIDTVGSSSKGVHSKPPSKREPHMKYWEAKYVGKPKSAQSLMCSTTSSKTSGFVTKSAYHGLKPKKANEGGVFKDSGTANPPGKESWLFSSIEELPSPCKLNGNQLKDEVMDFAEDFDVDCFLHKEESTEKQLLDATNGSDPDSLKPQEITGNADVSRKMPVKESIKFNRSIGGDSLKQRVQRKLDENDLAMAFGEDPGLEDLEWSEFIGPRNSLGNDADLTRMLASQARQISIEQNACL